MPDDRLIKVLRTLIDSPERLLQFLRALLGGLDGLIAWSEENPTNGEWRDMVTCFDGEALFEDLDTLKRIAEAGCYLEFDTIGFETSNLEYEGTYMDPSSDAQNIEYLEYLAGAGFGDKILVSQDVCMKWWQASYGGKGHAHVLENIVPRMKSLGWTEVQLNDILIDNSARAFAFV